MLAFTVEAVKFSAGAITNLKSLEWAKNIVRNNDKHLRGIQWRKVLLIECESVCLVFMILFWQNEFLECFPSDSPSNSFD